MELPFLPVRLRSSPRAFSRPIDLRRGLVLAAFATSTWLPAQTATPIAARTVINDPAWGLSALVAEPARTRPTSFPARLTNVSIRARAGAGADTLIAGAAVRGSGVLPTLVRAIGPGLATFGLADALRDPRLEIFNGSALAAQTTTLGPNAVAASTQVGAFPLRVDSAPGAPGDAALAGQLSAGTLTAHCSSASDRAGVALLEFYDASSVPTENSARFVNLSSRARVEPGDGLIVIGFVVAGEGNLTLLLRGVGATLTQFNVPGALADPRIELYARGVQIAANDHWGDAATKVEAAQRAVGAFALTSPNDAALVVTLPAGAYTLQVHAGGASGVALAEIHEVPANVVLDLPNPPFNVAESTNAAGLDLFRAVGATKAGENFVLSPYSIESALALAYAGADGETRTEMARVLRLPADDSSLQDGFAGLRRALDQVAENSQRIIAARTVLAGTRLDPIEWAAANRLFGQRDFTFRPSFLTLMSDGFEAPLQLLDFRTNPTAARATINSWVEEQTRERIRNLISEPLETSTRLVLVNALYMKAPWDTPFEKNLTLPRSFRFPTGAPRDVPTMHRTAFLGYAAEEGLTVVTLDYLGSELQCLIVLPAEGQSVDAAAATLTPAHFARWSKLRETSRRYVALALPKFKFESPSVKLSDALIALGMRQAFDVPRGSANFDRIAPRTPDEYLKISEVFHQTFVALDEEGTEAAAATAVVMTVVTSANIPPPAIDVRVDRPFLFVIQHRASGACLFLGRITDPK